MRALLVSCLLGVMVPGAHPHAVAAPAPMGVEKPCPQPAESAVEQWLHARHLLCDLSMEEQQARLRRLAQRPGANSVQDHLEKLALASCQPERTPGLLRQALSDIAEARALAQEQRELVALITALDRNVRLLEARNRELKADLERTITGIRDIETDIEGIHQNGGVR